MERTIREAEVRGQLHAHRMSKRRSRARNRERVSADRSARGGGDRQLGRT